jgi:GNAT superfamily N-acetyltransferase
VPSTPAIRLELATERDVPLILELIKRLAEYEQLADQVTATEDKLRRSLFGPTRSAEVVIAYADTEPAGYALWFYNYSTFLAEPGLYLEDLFVDPKWRGLGIGKALLRHLAGVAVDRGCGRMEWVVLDWNELAIGFYRGLGAQPLDGWHVFRLTADALRRVADREENR